MSSHCSTLHEWFNDLKKLKFPFDTNDMPANGLYIHFEKGEPAHGTNRIVQIGTHTGPDRLGLRLQEHFIKENKDRSIFRKNIGRCFLNKDQDSFLEQWNWSLTSRKNREKYAHLVDFDKQERIERKVTKYIQDNFNFVVIRIDSMNKRRLFKSRIISTVSWCTDCSPSRKWLGQFSPEEKIRKSGLWQVHHLYRTPLTDNEMEELENYL